MLSIDPALCQQWRHIWDPSKESYANNDPVGSLTDRGIRALNKTLSGSGTNRPTFLTNQTPNGKPAISFDGTNDFLDAAAGADWQFLHDGHGWTLLVVFKTSAYSPGVKEVVIDTGRSVGTQKGMYVALNDTSSHRQVVYTAIRGIADDILAGESNGNNIYNGGIWNVLVMRFCGLAESYETFEYIAAMQYFINNLIAEKTTISNTDYDIGTNPHNPLRFGAANDGTSPLKSKIAYMAIADQAIDMNLLQSNLRWLSDYFGLPYQSLMSTERSFNGTNGAVVMPDNSLLGYYASGRWRDDFCADSLVGIVRSNSFGHDWYSQPAVGAISGRDIIPGDIFRTQANTILIPYTNWGNGTDLRSYVLRSTDGARSFSVITVTTGLTSYDECTQIKQHSDGTLFLGVYGRNSGNTFSTIKLMKSIDDGASWTVQGTIANGQTDSLDYIEPGIEVLSGNNMIALIRDNTNRHIVKSTSSDKGATWSATSIVFSGQWGTPLLYKSQAGNLWTSFRDQTFNKNRARFSTDSAATWSTKDIWVYNAPNFGTQTSIFEPKAGYIGFAWNALYNSGYTLTKPAHKQMGVSIFLETELLTLT